MQAIVEGIPQAGEIRLTIEVSAQFNYSAHAARRLVHRFAADEISYLLRVGEPVLVAGERLVWRVPVELAFPHTGPVGNIGSVDVDVENGKLLVTTESINEMMARADELAAHYSTATGSSL